MPITLAKQIPPPDDLIWVLTAINQSKVVTEIPGGQRDVIRKSRYLNGCRCQSKLLDHVH